MTKKDFKIFADMIVDLNIKYPFSGEVVSYIEKQLKVILQKHLKFNFLKWNRYIRSQISKKMVEDKLKNGELCDVCLGKGHFDQSHDGFGRTLTCDECGGTGYKKKEEK